MGSQARTIRIVAVAVSAAYSIILYVSGVDLGDDLRRVIAYLPSLSVILAVAFDLWVWKWPGINRIANRPRIAGTWTTTIQPHADSDIPPGGNRGPISAATVIEQTYWTLSITLMTQESDSHSKVAAIVPTNGDSKERKSLYYTYDNEPQMAQRPRSIGHLGATRSGITGSAPVEMAGTYWTDRLTMGSLDLRLTTRRTDLTSLAAALDPPPERGPKQWVASVVGRIKRTDTK